MQPLPPITLAEFDAALWHYRATFQYFRDADTLVLRPEMGFLRKLGADIPIRLRRVNAPELSTKLGVDALAWIVEQVIDPYVALPRDLRVKSFFKETVHGPTPETTFDRWVAEVWMVHEGDDVLVNLSDGLVAAGHAVYY